MFNRIHDPHQLLRHKMEGFCALGDRERAALASTPVRVVEIGADQDIVRQADRSLQSFVLVQGLACSSKMLGNGKRQIVGFHLPGDMPDLQSLHLATLDTTIRALTPVRIAVVLHEHLRRLFENDILTTALWRCLASDAAIYREWVANVGQRDGVTRAAHLLSEIITRMHRIQSMERDSFDLPITQQELGDALGMSTVHTNRCLRALRQLELIAWTGATLKVLDRDGLAEIGDFNDDYLHLGQFEQRNSKLS